MKQAFFLLLFTGMASLGFARTDHKAAFYSDSTSIAIGVPAMFAQISAAADLDFPIELKAANVLNLEASMSHHKRYIRYNPAYIDWITRLTNNKWAAMALLAHEAGHHFYGHTSKKRGSRPNLELQADEFAGFILRKLGATLEESQQVMLYIAKTVTSDTHPARAARLDAIAKGWNKAIAAENVAALTNMR